VLSLVLAHGHQVSAVAHNISGHKDWVGVERETCLQVALARLLLLELDHLVKPTQRGQAR
jgi:hypothetical protein